MGAPLLVSFERSGFVEAAHEVDVAVVDARGKLVASAGDPGRAAAFRSSAKPIQARIALESGWEPHEEAALATACASHNGEPAHVEMVRAMLARSGLAEDALRCPPDFPLDLDAMANSGARRRVTHNCSGKHAGMLGACVAAGWPLESYRDPAHPLQRLVLERLEKLCGVETPVLVDGCGVPTPVAPLAAFARAFLAIDDGGPEAAAMRAHPFQVGGSRRLDTDLMHAAPDVLCKSGAEGLTCISARGVGIAMRARDGGARARGPAVIHVLRALGLLEGAAIEALVGHERPPVLGGGEPVGEGRVEGTLERHG